MTGTKTKKLIVTILMAVMGISVLNGCQSKNSSVQAEDEKTETFSDAVSETEEYLLPGPNIWDVPSCDDEEHLKQIKIL